MNSLGNLDVLVARELAHLSGEERAHVLALTEALSGEYPTSTGAPEGD